MRDTISTTHSLRVFPRGPEHEASVETPPVAIIRFNNSLNDVNIVGLKRGNSHQIQPSGYGLDCTGTGTTACFPTAAV